ncbi:hypothetical protein HAX39_04190 [Citrobacter freundii]|nr:hypothetical protein [Citrobacter freundii]
MADIISEIKKNDSYSTKSEVENSQADDLLDSGLINVRTGGSITLEDDTVVLIKICTPTKRFNELKKNGAI